MTLLLIALFLQQVAPLNSVPPNPTAEWNQEADTLQTAQSYRYRYFLDGATTGAVFGGVACTGTASPFMCRAPLPVTLGGTHTISMTTGVPEGTTCTPPSCESPPSPPVTFTIELLGAPTQPQAVIVVK